MYSWACLIVTLTAIYAYRFYKNIKNKDEKGKIKNLVLFGILSICCCYTHYYALVTTGLINLFLLIYLIKNRKEDKKALINFLILAGIQILLYIPWLIYLIGQIGHVSKGFWIALDPISTPIEILSFQFRRQLDTNFVFDTHTIIALISSIMMYIYLGFRTYKCKKENVSVKSAFLAFGIYVSVIGAMLLISLIILQPVLFSRYLFVMTGLYIFWISYLLATEKNKIITGLICLVIIILGTMSNITNITMHYYSGNTEVYDYIKDEIKEDDIFIFSNIGNGGVVAAVFPNNKQYFLCDPTWDVMEAYKAYAPGMETMYHLENGPDLSFLDEYTGRIWLIDSEYMGVYDCLPKDNIRIIKETKRIDTMYHEYIYNIMLIEKY